MERSPGVLINLLCSVPFALTAWGQGPPDEVPQLHWVSAARALDENAPAAAHWGARELIEEQSERFRAKFGSAVSHGLREGHLAPEKFCTVENPGDGIVFLGPDSSFEFGASLLLAEVAVVATVTGVVPGFRAGAWVESLLELGDAVPLHSRSPVPDYVLVPAGRVVAEDRVFCGDYGIAFDPVVGTRVVVIGAMVQGVTPIGPGRGNSTIFAVVAKDGESLDWVEGRGPPSLDDLQARVDEAVSGNLFSATRHLALLPEFSKKRGRFGTRWEARTDRGCRLISVDRQSGEETEICVAPNATPEEHARFEKSWRQQCADGGAPPIATTVKRATRTRVNVCSR